MTTATTHQRDRIIAKAGAAIRAGAGESRRLAQPTGVELEAAAVRGKVVMTASTPGTAEIGLQVELLRHELTILGVYEIGIDRPHGYWPWTRLRNRRACLRLLESGQMRLDHLISHVVPHTEAEAMFRMMARGGDDWMGIVFTWTED